MRRFAGTTLLVVALVSPVSSQGQSPWTASFMLGPSTYDLSGAGNAFAFGAHFGWQPFAALVIEPGVAFFRYSPQVGRHVSYYMPELSIQAMAPWGSVHPYVGAGAGLGIKAESGRGTAVMLHGVGGIRAALGGRWGARGELRLRSTSRFGGHMADFTFGLTRRF